MAAGASVCEAGKKGGPLGVPRKRVLFPCCCCLSSLSEWHRQLRTWKCTHEAVCDKRLCATDDEELTDNIGQSELAGRCWVPRKMRAHGHAGWLLRCHRQPAGKQLYCRSKHMPTRVRCSPVVSSMWCGWKAGA